MRNIITWTLSILLGFEPALWAQGQAERMATIKNFIEQSQMAQRPMKLKDLYKHTFTDASDSQKADYRKFMETYGDLQMPKMDVSKVKGPNGTEFYRIQAVQNGQSITVELIDDGTTFARVNGKNLSYDDLQTPQKTMQALGLPAQAISEFFPTKPVSSADFLNYEQFQQLKVEDRNKYMKHIRQLMESMEAVEYSSGNQKTSSFQNLDHIDFISFLLQGLNAHAAAGECLAAGQTVLGASSSKGCGVDAKGNVPERLRKSGEHFCSNPKQILCHPTIYPSPPDSPLCVEPGRESTQRCNEKVDDRYAFNLALKLPPEKYQDLKRNVTAAAEKAWASCQENPGASDDMSIFQDSNQDPKTKPQAPPKKGKGKGQQVVKGKKTPSPDQKYNCDRFKERLDEIKGWCNNPDYKKDYPNLCPGKTVDVPIKDEPKPVVTPPVAPPPPQPVATCPAGKVCCDALPINMSHDKGACDASGGSTGADFCYNTHTKANENVFTCTCPGGFDSKMKCAPSKTDKTDKEDKKKKTKKDRDDKSPNWWLVGGIGLVLGWLFFKTYKTATGEWYKQMEPQPQKPPLPPPVTTPAPGPLPPQPRTGGTI